jgi:AraC-like DNA-binding protein
MTLLLSEIRHQMDPHLRWVHDKVILSDHSSKRSQSFDPVAWYIRSGGVSITTDQGSWCARPGDWVFILPTLRQQNYIPGSQVVSICYRFGHPGGLPWYSKANVLVFRDYPHLDSATAALLEATESASGRRPLGASFDFTCLPFDWLRIEAAFRAWLVAVFALLRDRGVELTVRSPKDDRVARALSVIQREPWAELAEPAELALTLGLSRRRLEQLFATEFGHGLAEERNRCRLAIAKDALSQPGLPIKQIARRFGFPSSPAFRSWFLHHAGISPRSFRMRSAEVE